jgi:hypothetical protein
VFSFWASLEKLNQSERYSCRTGTAVCLQSKKTEKVLVLLSGPFSDKAEKLTNLLSCFSSCNTRKQHKLLETTTDLDEKREGKRTQ